MRNKKAQSWLDVSEIFVAAVCIFLSFILLQYAASPADKDTIHNIAESRAVSKTTQYLRTIAQTPTRVVLSNEKSEEMTFSQAANTYFRYKQLNLGDEQLQPYYDAMRSVLLLTAEEDISFWQKSKLFFSTFVFAGPTVVPGVVSSSVPEKKITIGIKQGTEEATHVETIATIEKWMFSNLPDDFTIFLPAYFEEASSLPGTYYLEVKLE